MENRNLMMITMAVGALAVVLGAFGAHALKPYMDEAAAATYQTANRYHFYHTFLALTYLIWKPLDKTLYKGAIMALIGILLFSGSLYLLSLRSLMPNLPAWLGAITPLGGLCFILAWLLGMNTLVKKKKN